MALKINKFTIIVLLLSSFCRVSYGSDASAPTVKYNKPCCFNLWHTFIFGYTDSETCQEVTTALVNITPSDTANLRKILDKSLKPSTWTLDGVEFTVVVKDFKSGRPRAVPFDKADKESILNFLIKHNIKLN